MLGRLARALGDAGVNIGARLPTFGGITQGASEIGRAWNGTDETPRARRRHRRHGGGAGGVIASAATAGHVYELEDGRVVRARNYLSHAEAVEAAGLWE